MIASIEKIDIEVRSLESCGYNKETFNEVLGKIQKAVDDLNLHSYSNLNAWVKSLDEEVSLFFVQKRSTVLQQRLRYLGFNQLNQACFCRL